MSETAVLLCGHGSRDPEAVDEFEAAAAALRARLKSLAPGGDFATGYLEFARPTIARGPGCAPGARRAADPRDPRHAVRREPRQERSAVGDEQLHRRQPGHRGAAWPRPRDRAEAARRRCRSASPQWRPWGARGTLADAARRRRPRHQRPRRQFQHRQDWRACCGRVWGSAGPRRRSAGSLTRASTRRSNARRGSASAASSCSRISCSPESWSNASTPRPMRSRRGFPRSNSSRRGYLRDHAGVIDTFIDRIGEFAVGRAEDELPIMQIPHADHRLRRRGRHAAAGPPSSRARRRGRIITTVTSTRTNILETTAEMPRAPADPIAQLISRVIPAKAGIHGRNGSRPSPG